MSQDDPLSLNKQSDSNDIDYRLNIDGCYIDSDRHIILIAGWLVSPQGSVSYKLTDDNEQDLNQYWELTSREDVRQALSLGESIYSTGFVIAARLEHVNHQSVCFVLDENRWSFKDLDLPMLESASQISGMLQDESNFWAQLEDRDIIAPAEEPSIATVEPAIFHAPAQYFVDHCFVADGNLVCFKGWSLSSTRPNNVWLYTRSGKQIDCIDSFLTYARDDVLEESSQSSVKVKAGFIGFARTPDVNDPASHIVVDYGYYNITQEVIGHPRTLSVQSLLKSFLDVIDIEEKDLYQSEYALVQNILHTIWDSKNKDGVVQVKTFGEINNNPKVSLIIPIYGRYDFIQLQMSYFSKDDDFSNYEIIYVLDDPKIEREFFITCHGVYQTFGLPFKTVFSGVNLGFAGANNLGVSQASSPLILAMNSDIMPSQNGWLARLVDKFHSLDKAGILGSTLIYEDRSIQHIGMKFEFDAHYPDIWMNYHPYKGFHEDLVSVDDSQAVMAVTGALMLMDKRFYEQVGGFDTDYILGDFEDSDLCLKVHNAGKLIYLDTQERLYHLERLSQDLVDQGNWKYKLTLLNGLYQKFKWDDLIKVLREQY